MRNSVMKNQNYIATASVATMLAVMFVGAILPTPLYPLFREAFGFSAVTLTFVYAVYVLGNLVALLLFGDRKSTRLNSSHEIPSRMPSSA